MTALPSGTVTFLFTDIEGSTRLWEEQPEQATRLVADHDRIMQTTVEAHGVGCSRQPAGGPSHRTPPLHTRQRMPVPVG